MVHVSTLLVVPIVLGVHFNSTLGAPLPPSWSSLATRSEPGRTVLYANGQQPTPQTSSRNHRSLTSPHSSYNSPSGAYTSGLVSPQPMSHAGSPLSPPQLPPGAHGNLATDSPPPGIGPQDIAAYHKAYRQGAYNNGAPLPDWIKNGQQATQGWFNHAGTTTRAAELRDTLSISSPASASRIPPVSNYGAYAPPPKHASSPSQKSPKSFTYNVIPPTPPQDSRSSKTSSDRSTIRAPKPGRQHENAPHQSSPLREHTKSKLESGSPSSTRSYHNPNAPPVSNQFQPAYGVPPPPVGQAPPNATLNKGETGKKGVFGRLKKGKK